MKSNENIAYIVFDLETGGLNYEKNAIVEVAFIPVVPDKKGNLVILEKLSFDCLVKPYSKKLNIEQQALNVNNLKMEDIEANGLKAKDIIEAIIELSETIKQEYYNKARKDRNMKPILVGHNIDNFDIDFLKKFFELNGKNLYDYFNKSTIDTYTQARFIFKNAKVDNYKLETLCNYVGIRIDQAHRAFDDTKANALLFMKMERALSEVSRKHLLKL